MNAWIRLSPNGSSSSEHWHLLLGTSPQGMRVAHCGVAYPSNDELEKCPFENPPRILDSCETCQVASRRVYNHRPSPRGAHERIST